MVAKRVLGGCLACALGLASPRVLAQASGGPALEYRAVPGCPDEGAFRSRVAARTPATFDARAAGTVTVSLEPATPSRGVLVWTQRGEPVVREVSGATCDEVASALALVAAVLLEESATSEPGAARPPAATAVAETPPATPAPAPAPAISPGRPDETTRDEDTGRGATPLRFAVGAHAVATTGVGPALAGGVQLFGEATIDVATRPAARLSLAWYPGTDRGTELGNVEFSLLSGRLDACPATIEVGSLSFWPCGSLDVGRLSADATGAGGTNEARLRLAPGALVRVAWPETGMVALEIEGGAAFPLDRYEFYFAPRPDVYSVPPVSGFGGIGIAVRFP